MRIMCWLVLAGVFFGTGALMGYRKGRTAERTRAHQVLVENAKLQARIDVLETAAKTNAAYIDLLEKEKKELTRQRDIVVRTLDALFRAGPPKAERPKPKPQPSPQRTSVQPPRAPPRRRGALV